jgi:hypothetical protein
MVWLERLGKLKKFSALIGTRTHYLLACVTFCIFPVPSVSMKSGDLLRSLCLSTGLVTQGILWLLFDLSHMSL